MSGSVTVIGGHTSIQGLTGLVTVPSGFTSPLTGVLQSLLTAASGAVSTSAANFANLDVAGQAGPQTVSGGTGSGVLVLSNQDSTNATTAGNASVSINVPAGYNTLVVQAPGSETVNGNGASNMLAVFGGNSSVNFVTGGGNGSIFAGGSDNAALIGANWQFTGSPTGSETVAALANGSSVTVSGSKPNYISANALNVSLSSAGTGDLDVVYGGTAQVSVAGTSTLLVDGGAVTVHAVSGVQSVQAAFANNGGQMDFINNSGSAVSVLGGFTGAVGGNLTVFGGTAGGYFQGGPGGNNSLVGGTGAVTLIGNGDQNILVANGSNNELVATGGSTTMTGAAGSSNNAFVGGTGTLVVSTSGSNSQSFFVGVTGQEVMTGSTVGGAVNDYFFLQDSTGSGSDIIQNFRLGTDHIYINPFGATSTAGVNISAVAAIPNTGAHPKGGAVVILSDSTQITLYGVSANALQGDVGKTYI